jgi:uncharacterized protein YjbI with pentapeptide repeats
VATQREAPHADLGQLIAVCSLAARIGDENRFTHPISSREAPRTSTYNLQSAYLGGTPTGGKYHVVNLQGANLSGANLQSADLGLANLQDTKLIGANLQSASLGASNLQGARFSRANLQGAILYETDLSHPVGLTQEQLASAKCDEKTKPPPGLTIT